MRALLEIQINLICLSPASGIGRVANVGAPTFLDSDLSHFCRVEVIGTLLTSPPPNPTPPIKVHTAIGLTSFVTSTAP